MKTTTVIRNDGARPKYSLREKYEYLCSKLKVAEVDIEEHDALLYLPGVIVFCFRDVPQSIDEAITDAITYERSKL